MNKNQNKQKSPLPCGVESQKSPLPQHEWGLGVGKDLQSSAKSRHCEIRVSESWQSISKIRKAKDE
ncbi:hypothetical protein [Helicobacter sp. T3_23-1056]